MGSRASSRPHFTILADQTFHVLGVRHMIYKHIPSSMNKYNCTSVRYHADAQELLRVTPHKMSRKPSVAHQYIALLTFPDRTVVESVTEVPDLQVDKIDKSSILCLFFLPSVVSQASMITAEAIIVIQMQNQNFGYCTHHLLFKFKCENPLKGCPSPLLKNFKVLCPWVFICKTTVHVQSFEQ